MTVKLIPDTDHVARHCPPGKCEEDMAGMDAFLLRPDEPYLSVDWLERTGKSELVDQLTVIVKTLQKRGRTVKTTDGLARLNVGTSIDNVLTNTGANLEFQSLGQSKTNTYSGIYGIPSDRRANEKVALQLSVLTLGELHPPPLS